MLDESGNDWNYSPSDCPSWCCGDHEGQMHPEDAIHSSCLPPQPVISRTRAEQGAAWDQVDLWSQDAPPAPQTAREDSEPFIDPFAPSLQRENREGPFIDEATYFDVVRMQWVAGGDEWLFVGDGRSSWLITLESARRIFRAMGQILTG